MSFPLDDEFPPPGYIKSKSSIDGIEMYKPIPVEESDYKPVIDFLCPQCGATTGFNVADGGLTCTHCGYYEALSNRTVGKKATKFEFTLETMERDSQGWGEIRNELECQQCGACVTISIESLTHTCAFCGSNKVIQRRAPQDQLRPRFLVPFGFQVEECRNISHDWLGSSWLTPSNLRNIAKRTAFSGFYVPFWTFSAVTNASWKAEVGHEKRKRYYQDGEWKERVEIEWRWEKGNIQLIHEDLLVNGSSRFSHLLIEKINEFNLIDLVEYDPKYLAGLQAQAYDTNLESAWTDGRDIMRELTREACLQQASTSMVRNFSMKLEFSDEAWRYILLPYYFASYKYDNNSYQVMINGQTKAIAGQRPVDWTKVWLAIVAILSPGMFLGVIGIITLIFGGIGILIGGAGFFLLIVGLIISFFILRDAQAMDDI